MTIADGIGETAAKRMDVTGREIAEISALLGAGVGEPLPDLEDRHAGPGVDPIGDQPLPGQPLVGAGAKGNRGIEEAPAQLDAAG